MQMSFDIIVSGNGSLEHRYQRAGLQWYSLQMRQRQFMTGAERVFFTTLA